MKLIIGLILGASIGVGCRMFAIPLPGPNAILGALLGIAMATGYEVTDRVLSRRAGATERDSSTLSVKGEAPRESAPAESSPP
jgi:XapX domain-containing protein